MDLLQFLRDKAASMGNEAFAKAIGVKEKMVESWFHPTNPVSPPFNAAAKALEVFDTMGVDVEPVNPADSELLSTEYEGGIVNNSYCPPEWGKKKAAWDGRDVCLCMPTYGEVPESSFFGFMCLAMKYRMGLRFEHRGGDSMIARSRNQLARRFMRTGATWSVWLDSDMIFPFGHAGMYRTATRMDHLGDEYAGASTIERLIGWKKTVVGGCYWDRRGGGRLIAGGSSPILNPIPSNSLQAVNFVGTGCLAVHRQVYEDIAKKFPETMQDDALGNEAGFFTPRMTPAPKSRMMGEDESFQWRATEAGHPAYLDLGVICGHVGTVIHGMPKDGSRI